MKILGLLVLSLVGAMVSMTISLAFSLNSRPIVITEPFDPWEHEIRTSAPYCSRCYYRIEGRQASRVDRKIVCGHCLRDHDVAEKSGVVKVVWGHEPRETHSEHHDHVPDFNAEGEYERFHGLK